MYYDGCGPFCDCDPIAEIEIFSRSSLAKAALNQLVK
jgi:hypothetical protein